MRRREDARLRQVGQGDRSGGTGRMTGFYLSIYTLVPSSRSRYGTGAASGPKEANAEVAAVPPSVPVRVAYKLQLAGHRYLDVR